MIDRAQLVAFLALLLGSLFCYLGVRQHAVCLKSRIVAKLADRYGDLRAFQFVVGIGILFCLIGLAIAWIGR
jgi:hypothetical protein